MCDDNINQEIATLLHLNSHLDSMAPISIDEIEDEHAWPELKALRQSKEERGGVLIKEMGNFRRRENVVWREWFVRSQSPPKSPTEDGAQRIVKLNGSDIPTEYEVYEPRRHEMPVIGTYIDSRITPGFFYKIRINGSQKYQFKGRAMRLLSIGKGYGRRITFASKSLNNNSNFFWSDSHDHGYAFSICAVFEKDEFGIYDADHRHVGSATVEFVSDVQNEISHVITEQNCVEKTVSVTMRCTVNIKSEPHGLVSLRNTKTLNLDGRALVVKAAKSNKAVTKYIEDVEIYGVGRCTLRSDD